MARLSIPTQRQSITEGGEIVTDVWWRFFQGLYRFVTTPVSFSVQTGIAAAGTTQGTATQLKSEWNVVSTVPANSGVILADFGPGLSSLVFNTSATLLRVYPPVGGTIDALAANVPYQLAAGTSRDFYQVSPTEFRSR